MYQNVIQKYITFVILKHSQTWRISKQSLSAVLHSKLLSRRYIVTHLDRMKALLNREDAVASRLEMASYRQYVDELEHNWQDDLHMGCCVVHKDDGAERPIAMAIASASVYRADVQRPTELNWRRTNACMEKEEQRCLESLVRVREFRGSRLLCDCWSASAVVLMMACCGCCWLVGSATETPSLFVHGCWVSCHVA